MDQQKSSTYRRPATEQARENRNAYQRRYRQEHPEKAQAWRERYVMRLAARLQAEQASGQRITAGGDGGGD